MKNITNKLTWVVLFTPSLCFPLPQDISHTNPILRINQSVYSMDKNLINAGYKIENINNHPVIMFQNKPISSEDFYMPGIQGDQAIKLYIEIKNTIKNATINLNDSTLQQKTDKFGTAYIDLYRMKGKYHLQLENSIIHFTSNYYFKLDKPLKLICHGTNNFTCDKIYY